MQASAGTCAFRRAFSAPLSRTRGTLAEMRALLGEAIAQQDFRDQGPNEKKRDSEGDVNQFDGHCGFSPSAQD